jgi:hypothetical protein
MEGSCDVVSVGFINATILEPEFWRGLEVGLARMIGLLVLREFLWDAPRRYE